MGYRFTIEQVNMVAQLVEGNTLAVLEEMLYSNENYHTNKNYIMEILRKFKDNFFTNNIDYYNHKKKSSYQLNGCLNEINDEDVVTIMKKYWDDKEKQINRLMLYDLLNEPIIYKIEYILKGIHRMLGNWKVNVMLLPGYNKSEFNNYLTNENLLKELISLHPEHSHLILQPKEIPNRNNVFMYNSFKYFELATNNFKDWPGLLLWNKNDAVFFPLSDDIKLGHKELIWIFNIIRHEKNPIQMLKSFKSTGDNKNRYSYILHLSDLHFGLQSTNSMKDYLIKLIKGVNKSLDDGKISLTVITGDLVDSPNDSNYKIFKAFRKELAKNLNNNSVTVFGNHDLYNKGIKMLTGDKQCLYSFNDEDKIEIIEELKIIIIKVDSNAEESGSFAEGKVGQAQLQEIDSQLSNIEHLDEYFLLVVLHHHPIEVGIPAWRKYSFYKRLFHGIAERTLTLLDANVFMDWVNKRNISLVLHGHKHIPNVDNCNGADIVACGSSTGNVVHIKKGLTYLTFNLIKYDTKLNKPISCTTYFVDDLHIGLQHLNVVLLG